MTDQRKTMADEWFDAFIESLAIGNAATRSGNRRMRALGESIPMPRDAALREEQAYDAETEALRQVIRGGHFNRRPRLTPLHPYELRKRAQA